MIRKWAIYGIALTLGGVAALLLAEIALRAIGYSSRLVYQPNPYYGWNLTPGRSFAWKSELGTQQIEVNSRGFRDVEHADSKPPGTFRILALGDSFTEALQVPLEATYVKRLASDLAGATGVAGAVEPETINTGLSGFGTDNELLLFRREGPRYQPDLVILGFYVGNDVRNNSRDLDILDSGVARKPYFEVVDDRLVLRDYPFPVDTSLMAKIKYQVNTHLLTYAFVREIIDQARHREPSRADGASKIKTVPLDLNLFKRHPADPWLAAWRVTDALLQTLDRDVRDQSSRLVVVLIPTRFQVHRQRWEELVQEFDLTDSDWDVERPTNVLRCVLDRAQISYVDLLPRFLEQVRLDPSREFYLPNDGHWNKEGHDLASKFVTEWLVANGYPNVHTPQRISQPPATNCY